MENSDKYYRSIQDSVHNYMHFPKYVWDYIDNGQFQRLRDIKQLGISDYVFPGGVHTRFEHSLGTAHLANKFMEILKIHNPSEIEKGDRRNILIAGLIFNLGHGPFSYTFSKKFIQKHLGILDWDNQIATEMMFEYMIDENKIDIDEHGITKQTVLDIGKGQGSSDKKWMYSIINNKENSVDVEKFDYILRDAYNVGIKSIFFDPDRLINTARIIDNKIAFHGK